MKILFLHGWHSVPGGVKPTFLQQAGHEIINPELNDDDFEAAVATAQTAFCNSLPDVVVGSSRGGAVAMNIVSGQAPLILLCPAWKRWGNCCQTKQDTVILHSRRDDVIPFADSEELITRSGLPEESLIEVGSDHRLADQQSLAVMLWICELLGKGKRLPWLHEDVEAEETTTRRSGETERNPTRQKDLFFNQPKTATRDTAANPTQTAETARAESVDSQAEAAYVCDACGEEIIVPLDLTEGSCQMYVEDCPVCCRANTIHVQILDDGTAQIWAEPEQDYD